MKEKKKSSYLSKLKLTFVYYQLMNSSIYYYYSNNDNNNISGSCMYNELEVFTGDQDFGPDPNTIAES